jgi:hypothetical protein
MSGTFIWPDGGGGLAVYGTLAAPINAAFNFANYPSGSVLNISTVPGVFSGTLPAAAGRRGVHYIVKDITGNLPLAAFTVARAAAESIEGVAANYIYGVAYGALHIVCDGTDWWVL